MTARPGHAAASRPSPAIIVACAGAAALVLAVCAVHVARVPSFAGDDLRWIAHARRGLGAVWGMPSPYRHYRPAFGTWLHLCLRVGSSPRTLLALGLALHASAALAVCASLRRLLGADRALAAATIVAIHPALVQHVFWVSGQIDGLCLLFSLVALRAAWQEEPGTPARIALTVGGATLLAALAKEIALALPLILVLLPDVRRRALVVSSSLCGAATAAAATLLALHGPGRSEPILAGARPRARLLYPTRLIWPFDLEDIFLWRHGGSALPVVLPASATLLAAAALLLALARQRERPSTNAALLLGAAGAAPWILRQDDRALGLGVAGLAIAAASLLPRRALRALPIVLALLWLPRWTSASRAWIEASTLSRDVAAAGRAWRAEAPGRLLVTVGSYSRIRGAAVVADISEGDPCAMPLASLIGYGAEPVPARVSRSEAGVTCTASGESRFSWGTTPIPEVGVVHVAHDPQGYAIAVTVGPVPRLRPACGDPEVRVWDGVRFVRPPGPTG